MFTNVIISYKMYYLLDVRGIVKKNIKTEDVFTMTEMKSEL